MQTTRTNWAGNLVYQAPQFYQPTTVPELQEIVAQATKLRALGSCHSFNQIADSEVAQVSLASMQRVFTLNEAEQTVTIDGGTTYSQLCPQLHRAGYALHNLASLPHISVAGACATATHGSGDRNGNLATAVVAMEFVLANGDLLRVSRASHGAQFGAFVAHLGALGVVSALTLAVQPTFTMQQDVYEYLPFAALESDFDAITSSAYSVSLFTDWQTNTINQVWLKRLLPAGSAQAVNSHFYGAALAARTIHPIVALSAESVTAQMGIAGPWHERLPHFRIDQTPSAGAELQTEYFVPRHYALPALQAVAGLGKLLGPQLMISEVRTVAADTLWMSPAYQQDCIAIHFTWLRNWDAVQQILPALEAALAPYHAGPHWGKLFTIDPALLTVRYPQLPAFGEVVQQYDPAGKFRNTFVQRVLGSISIN
jgi:alditol oxidase